jgi:hypothetical protein
LLLHEQTEASETKKNRAERNLRRRPNLWPRATEATSEHNTTQIKQVTKEKCSLKMFSGAQNKTRPGLKLDRNQKSFQQQNETRQAKNKNKNLRRKLPKTEYSA